LRRELNARGVKVLGFVAGELEELLDARLPREAAPVSRRGVGRRLVAAGAARVPKRASEKRGSETRGENDMPRGNFCVIVRGP